MSKAATQARLEALHAALAEEFHSILEEGVTAIKDGEVVKLSATPAHLAAIVKFLKDNSIEVAPTADGLRDALTKSLPFQTGGDEDEDHLRH